MARWNSWYGWVLAWSLSAMTLSLASRIGMSFAILLVVLLIAFAGSLEADSRSRLRGFAGWGGAAAIGAAVASLDTNESMEFAMLLLGIGLVGMLGEIFKPLPQSTWSRRALRALPSGFGFLAGAYLTILLSMFLEAPIDSWTALTFMAGYEWVIAHGLAGLGGGLLSEGIRRTGQVMERASTGPRREGA